MNRCRICHEVGECHCPEYVNNLEADKERLDWLEKMGRWADLDQFLVALEESWHNADLRQAIDKARKEE